MLPQLDVASGFLNTVSYADYYYIEMSVSNLYVNRCEHSIEKRLFTHGV